MADGFGDIVVLSIPQLQNGFLRIANDQCVQFMLHKRNGHLCEYPYITNDRLIKIGDRKLNVSTKPRNH